MGDSWFETDGTMTERTEAMSGTRIERDPLGELPVPADALYGIQTERARQNFPISHLQPLAPFVDAVVWIKKAAALVHKQTGRLDPKLADAIVRAADEVLAGQHRQHFVVDPYQAGAGTSHHMNCNEVLANRANELLGGKRGEYKPVHPNDHVNMAQSTNDVIPTAIRLAALAQLPALLDAMGRLARAFLTKGKAFDKILKSGRTHLQDATPIRLGQEFVAYGHTIERNADRVSQVGDALRDLGIGGAPDPKIAQRIAHLADAVRVALDRVAVRDELLPQSNRRRVLQVRPARLEDLVECLAFRQERPRQAAHRVEQRGQLGQRGQTDRGWDHVVRGLGHVDVVVRMHRLVLATLAAQQLVRAVGEDLVTVHVVRRPRARLVRIHDELVAVLPRQ